MSKILTIFPMLFCKFRLPFSETFIPIPFIVLSNPVRKLFCVILVISLELFGTLVTGQLLTLSAYISKVSGTSKCILSIVSIYLKPHSCGYVDLVNFHVIPNYLPTMLLSYPYHCRSKLYHEKFLADLIFFGKKLFKLCSTS